MKKPPRLPLLLRILAVLLVVVLAWMLRLRAVNLLPIDYDEDDYLRAAQQYAALIRTSDWRGFLETNYRPEHPPLAKIAYGLALLPAPTAPLVPDLPTSAGPASSLPEPQLQYARTEAAAFGTLEAALLALVNPLAGLFLAIHTFTIKYTSQVMLEGLPALTSLLAVLVYVKWKKTARRAGRSFGWLAFSALFLGLTAAGKYLYALVGFAILVDLLWLRRDDSQPEAQISGVVLKPSIRTILLWGGLALACFFLADPYLWPNPFGRLSESLLFHTTYATGAQEVQRSGYPFWQPLVTLMTSVPWHPGVFVLSLDTLISLLAITGIKRLWQRERVYGLWIVIALIFLLLWPTKWPQYILVLTAPLALAAADGLQVLVVDPIRRALARRGKARRERIPTVFAPVGKIPAAVLKREGKKALPWLVPGLIAFALLTLFPLLFQLAMSMTDFTSTAIRDGLTGGVWREVWLGLTGQVKAVDLNHIPIVSSSRQVHWLGLKLLGGLVSGLGGELLIFEVLWTGLSVVLQTALGLGVALILCQRGLHFKKGWQILFILPWAIPESVGAIMWVQIFAPSFGMLSLAGSTYPQTPGFGLERVLLGWQDNPSVALFVLLIPSLWYGFPFMMLAASAGLKLVQQDVLDAAALDGAGFWGTFREVIWPLLRPLLMPAIIIRAIFAFNQFYLFQVFDPPWPDTTLASLSYWLLNAGGSGGGQFAVSAALNVLTALILVGFILALNRWSRASQGVDYV
jgi:ABC-type sugar transport system permease subunit